MRTNCMLRKLYSVLCGDLNGKWSESHTVVSDSLWPHRLYSPWYSPGQNTGKGIPSPDLPNPGIKPGSPTLQADSLPAEPLGKPNLNGKEIQKRRDRGILRTDLLCCTVETNNTVRQLYSNKKRKENIHTDNQMKAQCQRIVWIRFFFFSGIL